jgi:hypothetical protein
MTRFANIAPIETAYAAQGNSFLARRNFLAPPAVYEAEAMKRLSAVLIPAVSD